MNIGSEARKVARYGRTQIDSFSTWHSGAGIDISRSNGDIFVLHDEGLFKYRCEKGTYNKLPIIAPLKTRIGAACISVNDATGEVAVVHQNGLNVYQPSGDAYKETVLEIFQGITAQARCIYHQDSGDIFVVKVSGGFYVHRKTPAGYEKMPIDSFGAWHSSSGIGIDQKTGDVFVVANHVGGGQGPYPVNSLSPIPDKWPKGDSLVRYRPSGKGQYMKMIVDWPVATLGGADLDVNTATGEVIMIADPGLYIYRPEGEKYIKSTVGAAYSRGEGAAVEVNENTGEIIEVADSYIRVITVKNHGEPIDAAMTRSCGVDVTYNAGTSEIIMVDNRGLTVYKKP
jgi:hypothetical protein